MLTKAQIRQLQAEVRDLRLENEKLKIEAEMQAIPVDPANRLAVENAALKVRLAETNAMLMAMMDEVQRLKTAGILTRIKNRG